jgi:lipoprotein-releasing system ATP-binding protein
LRFLNGAGISGPVNDATVIAVEGLSCARVVSGVATRLEIPVLSIEAGCVTLLAGPAGCGKNLLLRVLGLLEAADEGEVWFEGEPTSAMNEGARSELRNRRCGYVFASPFLLPEFTVIENIAMPLFKICEMEPEQARDRAEEMLNFAGLQDVATTREISPATQQRVALARALANKPAAIFIESLEMAEPGADVFRELLQLAAERYGIAVVASIMPECVPQHRERCVQLTEGRLVSEIAS